MTTTRLNKCTEQIRRCEIGRGAVFSLLLLTGCFNAPGGGVRGVFGKIGSLISGATSSGPDQQAVSGTLAIGESMIAELATSLRELGLTEAQIAGVQESARKELKAGVVAIQAGNLNLNVNMVGLPVEYAAPAVVRGAVAGLSLISADENTLKYSAVETIVGTSFKALSGSTGGLPTATLENLATTMAGGAVSKLTDAGFTADVVGDATKSVTAGSVTNLEAAGIPTDARASVAKALVTGAVQQLATIDLPAENVAAAVAGATEGAVASISATGLSADATVTLAGSLAAASVESLAVFKSLDQSTLVGTMREISSSAVEALSAAKIDGSQLGAIVKSIASASVTAVATVSAQSGFGNSLVSSGAAALAAGAISGLGAVSNDASVAASATENIISGTMSSLASSASLSTSDKSNAVANVVGRSVEALANLGSESTKTTLMGSVISTTMASLSSLGVASDAQAAADTVKAITTNATSALATAGFSGNSLSTASQQVVSSAVKGIDSLGVSGASNIGNIVSNVMSGVSAGLSSLTSTGKADENAAVAALNSSTQTATSTVSTLQSASNLTASELASVNSQVAAVVPPSVTYSLTDLLLPINTVMSTLTPTKTGIFNNCVVSPSLPSGLSLAPADCSIYGTPTAISSAQKYTITPTGGLPAALTIRVVSNSATISYQQAEYEFVGESSPVTIVPANLGATFTSCSANQPMPPGLILGPNCTISGTLDFFSSNNYEPNGVQVLNLDGTVASHAAGQGGDGQGPKYGFKYRVPYKITPQNGGVDGTPVNITLTLVPPFSIYDHLEYRLEGISGSPKAIEIIPVQSVPAGTTCAISPSLPSGFTINNSTCVISGSVSGAVPASKYAITQHVNGIFQSTSKILIGANFYNYGFDYQYGSHRLFVVDQYQDMVPHYGASAVPTTCVKAGDLPVGLSLANDCKISGTVSSRFSSRELIIYPDSITTGKPVRVFLTSMDGINVVESVTNTSVSLSWNAVPGATGYVVLANPGSHVKTFPQDGQQVTATSLQDPTDIFVSTAPASGTTQTVTHSGLTQGATYNYQVLAHDASYNYIAVGWRYNLSANSNTDIGTSTNTSTGTSTTTNTSWVMGYYPHRELTVKVGESLNEQPTLFPATTPSGCTSTPTLPAGLNLAADCKITGAAVAPSGYQNYSISPIGSGNFYPLDLWLSVDGPLNITSATTATEVNLSWPAADGANGYIVLAHKDGPVATNLSDYNFLPAGQLSATGDIEVGNFQGPSASHTGLVTGHIYSYKVYAYRTVYGMPNYFAVGTAGKVQVGSTPSATITYGSRIRSFRVGDTVSITPTVTSGTISGCVVSPSLPAGLSLNTTNCAITGTATTPRGLSTYTITPTLLTGNHPAIEIAMRVWENLNVTADSSQDDYITVSATSNFSGSLEYIYLVSESVPSSEMPSDFDALSNGQETKWGRVAYVGTSNSYNHEGGRFNASYFYTVFLRTQGFVGSGYLSRGSTAAQKIRSRFAGVHDLFLTAPYSGHASGTAAVAYSIQPHTDSFGATPSTYNSYLAIGTGTPSFSLQQSAYSIFENTGAVDLLSQALTNVVVQLRAIIAGNEITYGVRHASLDLGVGRHHKILGRNRFLGEDLDKIHVGTPTAVTADNYGNIVFASNNGTVNVWCQDTSEAHYCRGRKYKGVYTLAGADGKLIPGTAGMTRPPAPWNPWQAIGEVSALYVDRFYNIYIGDSSYHQILALCTVVSPGSGICAGQNKGALVLVAGNGTNGTPVADVAATTNAIGFVTQLAVDHHGNVIFAQESQPNVYVVCERNGGPQCSQAGRSTGKIYVVAGTGTVGDSVSSSTTGVTAESASIGNVSGLTVGEGDTVYLGDASFNNVLVVCGSNGWFITGHPCVGKAPGTLLKFAGDGTSNGSVNSGETVGTPARLYFDRGNNLFVYDSANKVVRVVCQTTYTNVPCKSKAPFSVAPVGLNGGGNSFDEVDIGATLVGNITGMAVDNSGNVILTDKTWQKLRALCFEQGGLCSSKTTNKSYVLAGAGVMAPMDQPSDRGVNTPIYSRQFSTAVDSNGNLFVADPERRRIYVQCLNDQVTPCVGVPRGYRKIFAGSGAVSPFQGDGVSLLSANLPPINSLAFEPGDNLLFSTGNEGYVYIICTSTGGVHCNTAGSAGTVNQLLGNGSTTGLANASGDISGQSASSAGKPGPLVTDPYGNVFVYDFSNYKLYVACFSSNGACAGRSSGTIYHLAGTGTAGDGFDDTATSVPITRISQMARLQDGNLVLADHGSNRIRLLCLNNDGSCSNLNAGSLYRWAGTGAVSGPAQSDGIAKDTIELGKPSGIGVTNSGDVIVQTAINPRIWVICNQTNYVPCAGRAVGSAYSLAGTGLGGNGPSNIPAMQTPIGPVNAVDADFEFGRLAIDPQPGHVYSSDGDARAIRLFTGLGR